MSHADESAKKPGITQVFSLISDNGVYQTSQLVDAVNYARAFGRAQLLISYEEDRRFVDECAGRAQVTITEIERSEGGLEVSVLDNGQPFVVIDLIRKS